jgi:hypothetical protein
MHEMVMTRTGGIQRSSGATECGASHTGGRDGGGPLVGGADVQSATMSEIEGSVSSHASRQQPKGVC